VGGLLQLIAEHQIDPQDIQEIAVGFAPGSDRALIKDNPQTGLEAKFSIEYAAAAAALDGALGLDSFTDEAVHRPEIRAMMKRVRRYQVDAEGIFSGVVGFTDVKVRTSRAAFDLRVDRVPGSPVWPLSAADREHKFLDCAGRAIGPDAARALLAIGRRTAELRDVSELTAAAVPGGVLEGVTAGRRRA
jgi:2-methylcitrate dehydratase PrpD